MLKYINLARAAHHLSNFPHLLLPPSHHVDRALFIRNLDRQMEGLTVFWRI
jgi:hypothetical protein